MPDRITRFDDCEENFESHAEFLVGLCFGDPGYENIPGHSPIRYMVERFVLDDVTENYTREELYNCILDRFDSKELRSYNSLEPTKIFSYA
jgi:hypothetical protein